MPASTAISTRSRSAGCALSRRAVALLRNKHAGILDAIRDSRDLDDATAASSRPWSTTTRKPSLRQTADKPTWPASKDMRVRIAATKGDAEDHQGHADGGGLEAAPCAGIGGSRAALRRAHGKVLGNIAAAVGDLGSAPRLLAGTGSDRVHLLVVCTAERGLCGPFNSAIVRLVRERANALMAEGKEVKIFCVGRKGYEQLRASLRKTNYRAHRATLGALARLRACRRHRRQDRAALR